MAENYVLLETIQLTQTAASVTFDNIPQTGYTDLKIELSALGNATEGMYTRFNGSTSGFTGRYLIGDGSTPTSGSLDRYIGSIMSQTATPNNVEINILNYTGNRNKVYSVNSSQENNGSTGYLNIIAGLWSNTSAITSITIETASSFKANSTFSLYGIAAFGTTPTVAPKADGGNIVANDGTYWYHAFLNSGYFVPQTELTCDVLVVAGGGGGGGSAGGAGGAGGLLGFNSQSLSANTQYPATIGAGGAGRLDLNGVNGNDSQFSSLTLVKGGGFGASNLSGTAGGSGGSGGGGSYTPTAGGSATPSGQGNAGGTGYGTGGGGGGGASQAGNTGGNGVGGNGSSAYSSWGSATLTGQNSSGTYYYAGGGGGSFQFSGSSNGGLGGGGAGGVANSSNGTAGTASTGGGGGGGWQQGSRSGGNGGSGIVIIRYPMV